MSNLNYWTKQEDKALLRTISNTPENIKGACERFAKKHNRSTEAARFRYYTHLRNNPSNKIFFTVARHKTLQNCKVSKTKKPDNSIVSKWKRILAILFE